MTKKLAGAAALIVLTMTLLVGPTTGCDLSVTGPGLKSDTTGGASGPGGTTSRTPAEFPSVP